MQDFGYLNHSVGQTWWWCQKITKVISIHPERNMNGLTSFHDNPSDSYPESYKYGSLIMWIIMCLLVLTNSSPEVGDRQCVPFHTLSYKPLHLGGDKRVHACLFLFSFSESTSWLFLSSGVHKCEMMNESCVFTDSRSIKPILIHDLFLSLQTVGAVHIQ